MWWDKKWVLACPNFGECTARVKLELTDFTTFDESEKVKKISYKSKTFDAIEGFGSASK